MTLYYHVRLGILETSLILFLPWFNMKRNFTIRFFGSKSFGSSLCNLSKLSLLLFLLLILLVVVVYLHLCLCRSWRQQYMIVRKYTPATRIRIIVVVMVVWSTTAMAVFFTLLPQLMCSCYLHLLLCTAVVMVDDHYTQSICCSCASVASFFVFFLFICCRCHGRRSLSSLKHPRLPI